MLASNKLLNRNEHLANNRFLSRSEHPANKFLNRSEHLANNKSLNSSQYLNSNGRFNHSSNLNSSNRCSRYHILNNRLKVTHHSSSLCNSSNNSDNRAKEWDKCNHSNLFTVPLKPRPLLVQGTMLSNNSNTNSKCNRNNLHRYSYKLHHLCKSHLSQLFHNLW